MTSGVLRASRAPRLVGRARELAQLEAELRRASTGDLRCVLLVADSGVGKTRLASEVLLRNRRSVVGLVARAYPLGATASFGLWAEALERHLAGLDANAIRELCGGVLDDLASLLRSVAAVRGSSPGREPTRLHLLEALTTIFRNLARTSPVAVFLDDIHLADASSVDALSYLSRNLAGSRVLVVAATRPAELAANPMASETVLGLEQDGIMRRLELAPLRRDHVAQLAEVVLDTGVAPEPLVEWLFDRSRGNPLFALGLLRSLIDEGGDLSRPQLRRLPEEMTQRVMTRMKALDEPALATLEVLATLGQQVELRELVDISGRGLDELAITLEALLRQRLVVEDERDQRLAYEIAHPLIQETIYRSIAGARRRSLHAGIARALVASGRLMPAAPHFVRSAEVGDPEAISALVNAFRQAEERESHREALALLEALLALIPVGDARWLEVLDVMALDAEWVADHTGDTNASTGIEAMRHIETLLHGSGDLMRRGLVKLRLGSFLAFGTGELAEAEAVGVEALQLFERSGMASMRMVAQNELGWVHGARGDLAAQAACAREVLAGAEEAGDRVLTMQALGSLAWTSFLRGLFADAEAALRRSAAVARGDGKLYRLTWSQSMLAVSLALEGRLDEAHGLLREARVGNPAFPDTVLLEIACWTNWIAGRFRVSADSWRESTTWTRGATSSRRGWGVPPAMVSMVELGDLDQARASLDLVRNRGQWRLTAALCTWAEGRLAEQAGDPEQTLVALEHAADDLLAQGCTPFAAFALADLADAALVVHNAAAAGRAAAHLETIAAALDRALHRGLAHLARATQQHLDSEGPGAAESARRAAGLLGGVGAAAMQARALAVMGSALSATDREAARQALDDAAQRFDACGSGRRRDRALRAVAALGQAGRRAASQRVPRPALTPRELEVVRLTLQGNTAREAGQRLHIGERTVETHRANAYAKLGVESRRELGRRAGELGIPVESPYHEVRTGTEAPTAAPA